LCIYIYVYTTTAIKQGKGIYISKMLQGQVRTKKHGKTSEETIEIYRREIEDFIGFISQNKICI